MRLKAVPRRFPDEWKDYLGNTVLTTQEDFNMQNRRIRGTILQDFPTKETTVAAGYK